MSYFTSPCSTERLYSHWKLHFISLPNIQFRGGMRKHCLSVLFMNIWQHCTLPAITAVSQLPFMLFHLINIVLLLHFPPCLAAHDEQLNGVTVKRVAVLWQHLLDVEVVVLGCHVQPPSCSLTLSLRCLDLTAVAHWRSQLAWPESVTASRKLLFSFLLVDTQFAYILSGEIWSFLNNKSP